MILIIGSMFSLYFADMLYNIIKILELKGIIKEIDYE